MADDASCQSSFKDTECEYFVHTSSLVIFLFVLCVVYWTLVMCTGCWFHFYHKPTDRTAKRFHIWPTVVEVTAQANTILLALLWSETAAYLGAWVYFGFGGLATGDSDNECPLNFGSQRCDLRPDESEMPFGALFIACGLGLICFIFPSLWLSQKFGAAWMPEIVTECSGHLLGFRWLAIITKAYGTLNFSDFYKYYGVTGLGWVTYNTSQIAKGLPGSLTTKDGRFFDGDPVSDPGGGTLGNLYHSAFALDSSNITKHIWEDGIRTSCEKTELDEVWCKTAAAWQPVWPLYWYSDDAYLKEFGARVWKLVAFGSICLLVLLVLRWGCYRLLCWWLLENDQSAEQSTEDAAAEAETEAAAEAEAAEAGAKVEVGTEAGTEANQKAEQKVEHLYESITDVLCDATGNAAGYCGAQVCYWLAAGLTTYLSQYNQLSQYGTNSPVMFLMIGAGFTQLILTQLTIIRWLFKKFKQMQLTDQPNKLARALVLVETHLSGSWAVYEQWTVGYFVWFVWKQSQFQMSTSREGQWRVLCALGNTIFTPSYPQGTEAPSEIFAPSPVSSFGFAILTFSIFVTWLTISKAKLETMESDTKTLMELLESDHFSRDTKYERHKLVVSTKIIETAQASITQRAQVEAFSVVVALAGENVCEALSEYFATCDNGAPGLLLSCADDDSETHKMATKMLISLLFALLMSCAMFTTLSFAAFALADWDWRAGNAISSLLPESCHVSKEWYLDHDRIVTKTDQISNSRSVCEENPLASGADISDDTEHDDVAEAAGGPLRDKQDDVDHDGPARHAKQPHDGSVVTIMGSVDSITVQQDSNKPASPKHASTSQGHNCKPANISPETTISL